MDAGAGSAWWGGCVEGRVQFGSRSGRERRKEHGVWVNERSRREGGDILLQARVEYPVFMHAVLWKNVHEVGMEGDADVRPNGVTS